MRYTNGSSSILQQDLAPPCSRGAPTSCEHASDFATRAGRRRGLLASRRGWPVGDILIPAADARTVFRDVQLVHLGEIDQAESRDVGHREPVASDVAVAA